MVMSMSIALLPHTCDTVLKIERRRFALLYESETPFPKRFRKIAPIVRSVAFIGLEGWNLVHC